jgi:hypothetical protein
VQTLVSHERADYTASEQNSHYFNNAARVDAHAVGKLPTATIIPWEEGVLWYNCNIVLWA